MKNLLSVLFSAMLVAMLSGCGDDGSSNAGGGNDAGMGTSGSLPIGDLGGDGSMGGSMDIGALMGGLMGGDDDDDDSDDGSSSDDGATNTAAPKFTSLGDVTINFEGKDYPLQAASSVNGDIIPTAYVADVNGTSIIQVAAYDIREDRLNLDTGSLVFTFRMADLETTGQYELLTPAHESGTVEITSARKFNNTVYLKGTLVNAELYSESKETTFTVNIGFDITVVPLPAQ